MDYYSTLPSSYEIFADFNELQPSAFADLKGGPTAPSLKGRILLYQLSDGVYIRAYIIGIPTHTTTGQKVTFHGFHIHDSCDCTVSNFAHPFMTAGGHWNPTNQPHPFHAGDLPPILSTNGTAMMSVYTSAFNVRDVLGKSFILHEKADDFTTPPAGNPGIRLACGVIKPTLQPRSNGTSRKRS